MSFGSSSSRHLSYPICRTDAELLQFEQLTQKIKSYNSDNFGNTLGCQVPCEYYEYQMVEAEDFGRRPDGGIILTFPNNFVIDKKEIYVYDNR